MLVRRYEMPWRRAYEVYAGIAWWLALLYFLGVGVAGPLPRQLALPLALACFVMGALRVAQALRMLVEQEILGEAEQALQTYLDQGAPLDHRAEVYDFLEKRRTSGS